MPFIVEMLSITESGQDDSIYLIIKCSDFILLRWTRTDKLIGSKTMLLLLSTAVYLFLRTVFTH
ncbi:MAG TPA: hypothetical protein DEP12_09910 [Planctomycetaceae bacterium]|nr:hypothetical protein [Planctomycetaceae bacterium]